MHPALSRPTALILLTLLIKLGVIASLASIIARFGSFKRLIFVEHEPLARSWNSLYSWACHLCWASSRVCWRVTRERTSAWRSRCLGASWAAQLLGWWWG